MKDGDVYKTSSCGYVKVVNYMSYNKVAVEFINTGYKTTVWATSIKRGYIRDPLSPAIHGMCCVGVGTYKVKSKAYTIWRAMLSRCYSSKSSGKDITYKGCSVAKDWHNFQVFAKWFEDNYVDGYELDKDLLVVGNKVYSEDTCVFIPRRFNCFITGKSLNRRLPVGVYYHHNKSKPYEACCSNENGTKEYLGYFNTPEQASLAWKKCKLAAANKLKLGLDVIDERLYPNIVSIIELQSPLLVTRVTEGDLKVS
jgi:hypothetical protein